MQINFDRKPNLLSHLIDIPHERRPKDGQDDETLVARVLNGDHEAFGAIIGRYKDAVFGVALSRLRNFHDAEDLTQITFVEAYDRLDRLQDNTRLGPWLRTIAINRSINYLKRRDRQVDFETIEEPISERASPEAALEQAELREQVLDAVGRLSKTQRETVTLYYISEYSLAEVAAIQEAPLGTVKRRLHEARKKLKQDMLEMVEHVLKDNAPDDAMADRVFNLLNSYPTGGKLFSGKIRKTLDQIGAAGKDGFVRALDLPHARSRLMAVHYLGQPYEQGGPPPDLALDLLKKSLHDSNRGVRMKAVTGLLIGHIEVEPEVYIEEIIPAVIPLLLDDSLRARRSVLSFLVYWIKYVAVSREQVRAALPLDQMCRAMVRERDPENIGRFQLLIELILKVQENDDGTGR